ncbi:MAG: hypothetical protein AAF772_08265 [Acidobacteriota bacterium]
MIGRWLAQAQLHRLTLLAAALCALLTSACASGGGSLASRIGLGDDSATVDTPWTVPTDALASQRLYRVNYAGPEGQLRFKLTLYLMQADRYRMTAADMLGRRLWTLGVDGADALWVDHRAGWACRADGTRSLELLPLTRLPLDALPKLLLGRVPAVPATELARNAQNVSYRDARDQRWSAGLSADGALRWWTLSALDEPVAWWRLIDEGRRPVHVFSDRRGQQQVRWREVIREAIVRVPDGGPVPGPSPPPPCTAASR